MLCIKCLLSMKGTLGIKISSTNLDQVVRGSITFHLGISLARSTVAECSENKSSTFSQLPKALVFVAVTLPLEKSDLLTKTEQSWSDNSQMGRFLPSQDSACQISW